LKKSYVGAAWQTEKSHLLPFNDLVTLKRNSLQWPAATVQVNDASLNRFDFVLIKVNFWKQSCHDTYTRTQALRSVRSLPTILLSEKNLVHERTWVKSCLLVKLQHHNCWLANLFLLLDLQKASQLLDASAHRPCRHTP
jgi:hypothetical protein